MVYFGLKPNHDFKHPKNRILLITDSAQAMHDFIEFSDIFVLVKKLNLKK